MLLQISIAALIIVLTTMMHASGMVLVMHQLKKFYKQDEHYKQRWQIHIYHVGGSILIMFFISLLEVLLWAVTYLGLNALQNFEQALYFSMVTFTTLGYGDVVLNDYWRLLSSFEAANGIIMFGWTTAIVIYVVQRVYTIAEK